MNLLGFFFGSKKRKEEEEESSSLKSQQADVDPTKKAEKDPITSTPAIFGNGAKSGEHLRRRYYQYTMFHNWREPVKQSIEICSEN